MITVYSKVYYNKFTSEVAYYFNLQTQGKPRIECIYENITDYSYYYSKYVILFNFYPRDIRKIEIDMILKTPIILNSIRSKRKLSVLSKFAFHLVMKYNDFAITKSIQKIIYNNNDQELILSNNAFLKGYYRLVPFFNEILSMPSPQV